MTPSSIEKEIKKLEGELKVKPDSIVFARLADNYRKKGNIEKAIELCTKGILKYPFYTTAKIILGKCYLEQERYAEALQIFKEVCKEDPRNMVAIKVAADIFLRQGMRDKAGALYLLLTKMDPANSALSSIVAKYPVGGASNDLFSILEIYKEDVFSSQPSPYPAEEDNVNVIEIESGEGTPVSGEDVTNRIATLFGEKVEDSTMENEVSVSQREDGFSEESTPVSGADISERIDQLFSTTTSSKVNKEEISFSQSIVNDLKDAVTEENIQVKENIPWESSVEEQTIEIKEALAAEEEKIIDNIPDLSIEESREDISGVDISQRLDEIFSSEGQNKLEQQKLNLNLSQEITGGHSEEREFYSSEKRSDEVTTLNVEEPLVVGEKLENIEPPGDFPEGEVAFGITETPDFTYEEKEAGIVNKESFEIGSINNEVFEQDVVSGEDIKEKIEELFTDKHETTKTENFEQEVTYPEKDEMVFEEELSATIKTETLENSIKEGKEIPLVSEQGEEPVFEDDFIPPEFEETLQFNGELFEQMLNPSDDAVFVEDLIEDKMVNAVTEEMDLSVKPKDEIDPSITLLDLDSEEKDIESLPEMSFSFDDVISEKSGEKNEGLARQDDIQEKGEISSFSSSDIFDKGYDIIEAGIDIEKIIENTPKIEGKISGEEFTFTEEYNFIKNDQHQPEIFNIEEVITKDNGTPEKEEVNYGEDLQEQPMVISGADIKERLDTFFPDSNTKEKISSTDNVKKEEIPEIWEQLGESSTIESEVKEDNIEEKENDYTLEEEKTFALTSEQLEEAIKNSSPKEETETTLPEVELYEEEYESGISESDKEEESEIDSRDRAFEIPDHVLTPTLADIYFQQGQYELALKIYKRLLERNLDKEKIEARIEEIKAAIAQQQNLSGEEKKIEISKNRIRHSSSKSINKESEDKRPLAGVRINKRILNAKKTSRRKKRENN